MAEITMRRQGQLLAGVFQVLQKHPGRASGQRRLAAGL